MSWFSKRLQRQLENGKMVGDERVQVLVRVVAGRDVAAQDSFGAGIVIGRS